MIVAISTNGVNITDEPIHALQKCGIAFMNISIDSAIPEVHDERRGRAGTSQKVRSAINRCVRAGISVIVFTYATKENIKNNDLKNVILFAKQEGAQGVRILLGVPAGKWLRCAHYKHTVLPIKINIGIHHLTGGLFN